MGGYPSGQRGLAVNQVAEAFGGSNPSPPTDRSALCGLHPVGGVWSGSFDGPARSRKDVSLRAHVAQAAEHTLGKGGVTGSSPVVGSGQVDISLR